MQESLMQQTKRVYDKVHKLVTTELWPNDLDYMKGWEELTESEQVHYALFTQNIASEVYEKFGQDSKLVEVRNELRRS